MHVHLHLMTTDLIDFLFNVKYSLFDVSKIVYFSISFVFLEKKNEKITNQKKFIFQNKKQINESKNK